MTGNRAPDAAVNPALIYELARDLAETVQTFTHDHAEEWDGGSVGYEAAELHSKAEVLLNALEVRP